MITLKPINVAIILLINYLNLNVVNGTEINKVKYLITSEYVNFELSNLNSGMFGSTSATVSAVISPLKLSVESNRFENFKYSFGSSSFSRQYNNKTHISIEEIPERNFSVTNHYKVDYVTLVPDRHLYKNKARLDFGRIWFPFVVTDAKSHYSVTIVHPSFMKVFYTGKFVNVQGDNPLHSNFEHLEPDIHRTKYSFGFAISNYYKVAGNELVDVWIPESELTEITTYTQTNALSYSDYISRIFHNINLKPILQIFIVPSLTETYTKSYRGLLFLNQFYVDMNGYGNRGSRLRFLNAKLAYNIARNYLYHTIAPKTDQDERFTNGIAALLQFETVDSVHDLHMQAQFGVLYTQYVFRSDADNQQIHTMITPNSGTVDDDFSHDILIMRYAAILKMFIIVLSKENFTLTLIEFFNRAYKLAAKYDIEDFKDAIITVMGRFTYEEVLVTNKWYQSGYPVVTAVYDDEKITFTQQKFTYDKMPKSTDSEFYHIPVTYTHSLDFHFVQPRPFFILNDKPYVVKHPRNQDNRNEPFAIVNVQQVGYYRVNYNEQNWNRIIKYLSQGNNIVNIHAANRAQLIDDSFQLAHAGLINYAIPLRLSLYLINEFDLTPWQAAMSNFHILHKHFVGHDEASYVKKLLHYIVSKQMHEMKFDDYFEFTTLNKLKYDAIFEVLCKFDVVKCIQISQRLFLDWKTTNHNTIPEHARAVIYCTAIRNGDTADWNFLKLKLNAFKDRTQYEYLYLLKALSCAPFKNELESIIEEVFSDTKIFRIHETIKSLGANANGKLALYSYLTNKKESVVRMGAKFINNIFITILDALTTQRQEKEYEQLIDIYSELLPAQSLDDSKAKLREVHIQTRGYILDEIIDEIKVVTQDLP